MDSVIPSTKEAVMGASMGTSRNHPCKSRICLLWKPISALDRRRHSRTYRMRHTKHDLQDVGGTGVVGAAVVHVH